MKTYFAAAWLTVLAVAAALLTQPAALAKQGATDPIPGTSKGAIKSGGGGGGGGKSKTPAPLPAPIPTAPPPGPVIVAATLTFSSSPSLGGTSSSCSGDYRVDPYYPTLLDMTLNVHVSSMSVPDGTVLYVNLIGVGGTLYPYTSNVIVVAGGSGSIMEKAFVTLGAGLAGVEVTDSNGNVLFSGK